MPTPVSIPDRRQALRIQRHFAAVAAYGVGLLLLGCVWLMGFIAAGPALAISAAAVLLNAGLHLAFRSGYNLRFADPSLTALQVGAAITLLMISTYHLDSNRGVALTVCFVIFSFGIFRLSTRQFTVLTLYALACYALVVNLIMHFRPEAIQSIYSEWISWIMLAAVLPGFTLIASRVRALQGRLQARNTELNTAVETIRKMATRDELTGLYNRAFFAESLQHALAQRERNGLELAVLFVDIDHFKKINDTLGHGAGDRVLRDLAGRFSRCLRGGDIAARQGGDEFVVLIENRGAAADAAEVAKKLLVATREPLTLDGHELPLSCSIGVALTPLDGTDAESLLRAADVAMYRAKEAGRNRFRFFSKGMMVHTVQRLALEADLRRAVERGELRLLFQPKVEIRSGQISGAEALLRWQHPELGLLTPDRFMDIAEDSGLIVPIGHWVVREACRLAAAWPSGAGRALRLAVNLSPRQFRDPGLITDLRAALHDSGLAPERLELEVTESSTMSRPERALSVTQALRSLGVGLAMDDFGTGYSSLSTLRRFPFTSIKVDRAFVRELPDSVSDAGITRATIAMAHSLGLTVTAEGVEHRAQVEFLRGEGCEEYQGYLCSPPVPEAQFLAMLEPVSGRPSSLAIPLDATG